MADEKSSKSNNDEKSVEQQKYNPKLDFYSDKFDPLLALQSTEVQVPVSSAKIYDNLSSYQSAVEREKNPQKFVKQKKPEVTTEAPIERRWLPHQVPIPTLRAKRKLKNVFTKMEKVVGPLGVLKKCVEEKLRVKVYTRNEQKIRGYCLAYIVAFDKHMNLALEDVTEVWSRRKKKKVPALDSIPFEKRSKFQRQFKFPEIKVTLDKTDKKIENCTRHLKQVMVRGEHVVLVSIINNIGSIKPVDVAKDEPSTSGVTKT